MSLRKPQFLYFIYQRGILDCVCMNRQMAMEMSECPEGGDRSNFRVEQWSVLSGIGGFALFKKVIQWEKNSKDVLGVRKGNSFNRKKIFGVALTSAKPAELCTVRLTTKKTERQRLRK